MPSVDTISTELHGSATQEPAYWGLTDKDYLSENGNLLNGIRKLKFMKNVSDEGTATYEQLIEPTFSRTT